MYINKSGYINQINDIFNQNIMSSKNPYQFLEVIDSDDEKNTVKVVQKAKKRDVVQAVQVKKEPVKKSTLLSQPQPLPEPLKEKRQFRQKAPYNPVKDIGEGHTLDRRSGTGRVDKPRKQGGSKGGVGNLKDLQNPDKYIKPQEEETVVEVEVPAVPEPPTLDEYYKSKGVNLTIALPEKQQQAKVEINAEWISKEKLTIMQAKDKNKQEERKTKNYKRKEAVVQEETNLFELGFGNKPQPREDKPKHKKERVVIDEKDFPSL